MPKFVTIDGNISSGKSTIISKITEKCANIRNLIIVDEPVEEWESIKDEEGTGLLANFYLDKKKYGFKLQIMALGTRFKAIQEAFKRAEKLEQELNQEVVIFAERTILSDNHIFAEMLYVDGDIEHTDYQIYQYWYKMFKDVYKIDKAIYIKTTPEICFNRVHIRERKGEENIKLAYLDEIHRRHEMLYNEILNHCSLIINNDIDMNDDEYSAQINYIIEYMGLVV